MKSTLLVQLFASKWNDGGMSPSGEAFSAIQSDKDVSCGNRASSSVAAGVVGSDRSHTDPEATTALREAVLVLCIRAYSIYFVRCSFLTIISQFIVLM